MSKPKKLPTLDHVGFTSVRRLFKSPRRWFKGSYYSPDGTKCCLLGAIDHCYLSGEKRTKAEEKLKTSICKFLKLDRKSFSIAKFNDAKKRKFEDIRWVVQDAKI